ncbi:YqgQ family protein [Lentibacillus saliphilus]|uniref:YqgQ family protein n=1 Tax=Lentibacillus saliphilus TaxID=2737028 RepID=UPI001C30F501|nr:YqgQ family protein [Lentibacillus saliphilus]
MKTIYDVQQLLKKFGTFIYTGDRQADLELMEAEIKELREFQFIQTNDYAQAILLLRQEKNRLKQMEEKHK